MPRDNEDVLRGLTVTVTNPIDATDELCKKVQLCPGAHVYALSFVAKASSVIPDPDIPTVLATLHLQDSEVALPSEGCRLASIGPSFAPPPRWPASARLCVPPGVSATIILWYGHCS